MAASPGNCPVRILHLSDIHFRAGKAWDSDPVLHALSGFIAGEVEAGLAPDLVVITGDLAFAGKKAEYDLAQAWLERELWPALSPSGAAPLDCDRLLLVPGNHDADRDKVDDVATMVQDGLLAKGDQNRIASVLKDRGQRSALMKRHDAYLKFYARWLGVAQPLPLEEPRVRSCNQASAMHRYVIARPSGHGDRRRGTLHRHPAPPRQFPGDPGFFAQ